MMLSCFFIFSTSSNISICAVIPSSPRVNEVLPCLEIAECKTLLVMATAVTHCNQFIFSLQQTDLSMHLSLASASGLRNLVDNFYDHKCIYCIDIFNLQGLTTYMTCSCLYSVSRAYDCTDAASKRATSQPT